MTVLLVYLRCVLHVAAKIQECTRVRTLLFIMISVIIFMAAGLARGLAAWRPSVATVLSAFSFLHPLCFPNPRSSYLVYLVSMRYAMPWQHQSGILAHRRSLDFPGPLTFVVEMSWGKGLVPSVGGRGTVHSSVLELQTWTRSVWNVQSELGSVQFKQLIRMSDQFFFL